MAHDLGDPAAGPPGWLGAAGHRSWLAGQANQLIDFFRATLDEDGHFVELDDDGRPFGGAGSAAPGVQRLLTVARTVHSFALGELLGVPGCAPIVERGLEVLWNEHRDAGAGGYVESVHVGVPGAPDATKTAYGHAHVLLAASSAMLAGHDARALSDDVRGVLDEHFWSKEQGAAREAFTGEWQELEAYRGANSNMHLCEAYLAAFDATGEAGLAQRAVGIVRLVIDGRAREHAWMLPEHYDADWRPRLEYNRDLLDDAFRPYGVTIGHLLEWSRLALCARATSVADDAWLLDVAVQLFGRAVEVGWDAEHTGLSYTVDWDGAPANPDHYWWPVAEAIAASATLFRVTGDAGYEQWYRRFWDFAARYLIDHRRGGWYAELDQYNRRKDGPWFGKPDLYHALQCCLIPLLPLGASVAGALRGAAAPTPPR